MKSNEIKIITILGSLVIIGLIVMQLLFMRRAYQTSEQQLMQSIQLSLHEVATIISDYNKTQLPYDKVVHQYTKNYFIVNVNSNIDPGMLEYYLIKEFSKRNLFFDFEYGIYDCHTDRMIYGNYFEHAQTVKKNVEESELSTFNEYIYYFGIFFPEFKREVWTSIRQYYIYTGLYILIIFFFSYAIVVIFRQKKLSEIQKDFINNLTHEFRTPLSSLKLSSEVLDDRKILKEPERLMAYSHIIREQTQLLNEHTEKILNAAKSESASLALETGKVDIHHIIDEIEQSFDGVLREKNGKIIRRIPENIKYVIADEFHFRNMLFNIIDNSLKYCDKVPEIHIALRGDKKRQLIIEDNGPGIPIKYKNLIFKKFGRIPTGNRHNVKGFGLGLFYVHQLIKAHKWKIRLDKDYKNGTRFIITMHQ